MTVESILAQHRSTIVKKWFELVIGSYPQDGSCFLKNQKDPFANPVGQNTIKGLEGLVDSLFKETSHDSQLAFLDQIIRMRAVQAFSPSEAISFIFSLKDIVRESFVPSSADTSFMEQWLSFESRIDRLALIAFDIYTQCREKMYEIRVNELRRTSLSALKRANLITETPETNPDFKES